jgi:hypothetical protein
MNRAEFLLTSRGVSTRADCTQQYVSKLATEGLLPHVVASDGTRLFSDDTPALVRRLKAERLARRGAKRPV